MGNLRKNLLIFVFGLISVSSVVGINKDPDFVVKAATTADSTQDNKTMFQAYEWYLGNNGTFWKDIGGKADRLSELGITSVWLPPAYKGMNGTYSVGYDPYDLYDLGEFNQMGTVRTKYGTRQDYLSAIDKLHSNGIEVYADAVMNHKAGADSYESAYAYKVDGYNRNRTISALMSIQSWTVFNFPGRNGKYSTFKWDKSCFDGVDYDQKNKSNAIYRFKDKTWDKTDEENGNYDYLMFADIDLNSSKVRNELKAWGKWYVETANLDGFRLDAVKHMEFSFAKDWIRDVEQKTGKDLFVVGEYYSGYTSALLNYIRETSREVSLFDFPLYYKFKEAGTGYDLRKLGTGTLTSSEPDLSVTFVENHDTQIGQSSTTVKKWFKPLAYTYILTRKEGHPCVFYGDYYGSGNGKTIAQSEIIDSLLIARKHFAYGTQITSSALNGTVMGWVRQGDDAHKNSGLAAVISTNSKAQSISLNVGKSHAGEIWTDITGNNSSQVKIGSDGKATFKVNALSCSVYVNKNYLSKLVKPAKVSSLKAKSVGDKSLKLTWKNVEGADSYRVYKYDSKKKKWDKVASATKNEATVKNIKSSSTPVFMVRACRTFGKTIYLSANSQKITVAMKPSAPVVKVKSLVKKAKLAWNKPASNVKGYVIYMATSKSGKYTQAAKIENGNTKSATIKNLKSGKTYYFKVKAYRKDGSKIVWSNYSKAVQCKIS